jgi:hypothetical protein
LRRKPFLEGLFAYADPEDIPLPDVHDPVDTGDEVVDAAFQNGFKIGFEVAAGHLHDDPKGHGPTLLGLIDVRTDKLNSSILHLGHRFCQKQLKGLGEFSTELHKKVLLADPLPFKPRAVRDRNGDLGDLDLEAADLAGLGDQLIAGDPGNHVFVSTDPAGQDLRDGDIGDHGKAEVNGPSGGSVFFVGEKLAILFPGFKIRAQRQDKGMDPFLVIKEDFAGCLEIPGFDAAEGHGGPRRKVQGMHRCGRILFIGHKESVPVHFNAGLCQLLGHGDPAGMGSHEHKDVAFLKSPCQLHRFLYRGQCPHTRGKSGHAAVHQFYPLGAKDRVIGES